MSAIVYVISFIFIFVLPPFKDFGNVPTLRAPARSKRIVTPHFILQFADVSPVFQCSLTKRIWRRGRKSEFLLLSNSLTFARWPVMSGKCLNKGRAGYIEEMCQNTTKDGLPTVSAPAVRRHNALLISSEACMYINGHLTIGSWLLPASARRQDCAELVAVPPARVTGPAPFLSDRLDNRSKILCQEKSCKKRRILNLNCTIY